MRCGLLKELRSSQGRGLGFRRGAQGGGGPGTRMRRGAAAWPGRRAAAELPSAGGAAGATRIGGGVLDCFDLETFGAAVRGIGGSRGR